VWGTQTFVSSQLNDCAGIVVDEQGGSKRCMVFSLGDGGDDSDSCIPAMWYQHAKPKVGQKEDYHAKHVQATLKENFQDVLVEIEERMRFDFGDRPVLFNEVLLKIIDKLSGMLIEGNI